MLFSKIFAKFREIPRQPSAAIGLYTETRTVRISCSTGSALKNKTQTNLLLNTLYLYKTFKDVCISLNWLKYLNCKCQTKYFTEQMNMDNSQTRLFLLVHSEKCVFKALTCQVRIETGFYSFHQFSSLTTQYYSIS